MESSDAENLSGSAQFSDSTNRDSRDLDESKAVGSRRTSVSHHLTHAESRENLSEISAGSDGSKNSQKRAKEKAGEVFLEDSIKNYGEEHRDTDSLKADAYAERFYFEKLKKNTSDNIDSGEIISRKFSYADESKEKMSENHSIGNSSSESEVADNTTRATVSDVDDKQVIPNHESANKERTASSPKQTITIDTSRGNYERKNHSVDSQSILSFEYLHNHKSMAQSKGDVEKFIERNGLHDGFNQEPAEKKNISSTAMRTETKEYSSSSQSDKQEEGDKSHVDKSYGDSKSESTDIDVTKPPGQAERSNIKRSFKTLYGGNEKDMRKKLIQDRSLQLHSNSHNIRSGKDRDNSNTNSRIADSNVKNRKPAFGMLLKTSSDDTYSPVPYQSIMEMKAIDRLRVGPYSETQSQKAPSPRISTHWRQTKASANKVKSPKVSTSPKVKDVDNETSKIKVVNNASYMESFRKNKVNIKENSNKSLDRASAMQKITAKSRVNVSASRHRASQPTTTDKALIQSLPGKHGDPADIGTNKDTGESRPGKHGDPADIGTNKDTSASRPGKHGHPADIGTNKDTGESRPLSGSQVETDAQIQEAAARESVLEPRMTSLQSQESLEAGHVDDKAFNLEEKNKLETDLTQQDHAIFKDRRDPQEKDTFSQENYYEPQPPEIAELNPIDEKWKESEKRNKNKNQNENKPTTLTEWFKSKGKFSSLKPTKKQGAIYSVHQAPATDQSLDLKNIFIATIQDSSDSTKPVSDIHKEQAFGDPLLHPPTSIVVVDETTVPDTQTNPLISSSDAQVNSLIGQAILKDIRQKYKTNNLSESMNSTTSLPVNGSIGSPHPELNLSLNGSHFHERSAIKFFNSLAVPGLLHSPVGGDTQIEEDTISMYSRRGSTRQSFDSGSRKSVDYRIRNTTLVVHPTVDEKPKSVFTNDESFIKNAIPFLPVNLAVACLILNIILPGSGTALSGLSILCCGQPRVSNKDDQILITLCANFMVGLAQLFTVTFLLIGWFWSIGWGIKMVILSVQYQKDLKDARAKELQTIALSALGSPKRPSVFGV